MQPEHLKSNFLKNSYEQFRRRTQTIFAYLSGMDEY